MRAADFSPIVAVAITTALIACSTPEARAQEHGASAWNTNRAQPLLYRKVNPWNLGVQEFCASVPRCRSHYTHTVRSRRCNHGGDTRLGISGDLAAIIDRAAQARWHKEQVPNFRYAIDVLQSVSPGK